MSDLIETVFEIVAEFFLDLWTNKISRKRKKKSQEEKDQAG